MDAPLPSSTASIALIGAGKVGTAVAHLLEQAGHAVAAVASRTDGSAQAAAARFRAQIFRVDEATLPSADIYLLGVPDDAIEPSARALSGRIPRGAIVIHLAGVFGTEPLSSLEQAGNRTVALHPVQACPDIETAIRRLPGSCWGVTCSSELEEWARRVVVDDLRGAPVMVPEESRPLWHAASVMTSNGIAAVMGLGESFLDLAGISRDAVVLGPLAAGTVQNAREGGGGSATLTGPIVRGDVSTISRHLAALADSGEAAKAHYVLVARAILTAAIAGGRITAYQGMRIEEVLNG